MKHIAYRHAANVSLLGAMASLIRQALPKLNRSPIVARPGSAWPRRIVACLGWILVLIVQAALVLVVREVITLCHGVIDLYLDLAKLQLDLTSQYVTATSPK